MKERFHLYELSLASSLKTFGGKIYELKGCLGIEKQTGEIRHVSDLYYRTRSVVSNNRLLAKRKTPNDELVKVKGRKKVK